MEKVVENEDALCLRRRVVECRSVALLHSGFVPARRNVLDSKAGRHGFAHGFFGQPFGWQGIVVRAAQIPLGRLDDFLDTSIGECITISFPKLLVVLSKILVSLAIVEKQYPPVAAELLPVSVLEIGVVDCDGKTQT